ncbi:cytochrome c oxidase subunit II transmembrane domain-containing protein [Inmirania thermothiophila]|uniref:cytochrome c oxidase subunit II transmembrane domain-containing protein n=1 Tax=Inmirania thermothiophila TaxID=1750597 RepID=UPI001FE55C5D|nr:cytochrome c oxidase subunit II transmembrane domain-containing protein [Inmirania thermothiophila]
MAERARPLLAAALALPAAPTAAAPAWNLPQPATPVAREIFAIHTLTGTIVAVLTVLVFAVVLFAAWRFRRSRGHQPDLAFHRGRFGAWSWLVVPVLVLGIDLTIAGSARETLKKLWVVPRGDDLLVVRVTGHQWWWEYEYPDLGIRIESRALPQEQAGAH